jgi:hypothetical protein
MSAGSTIHSPAYILGRTMALLKLGTVAGPISYATREAEESPRNFSSQNMHNLWREMDGEPAATGEESSMGLPNKSASDDYGTTRAEGTGGAFDHNAPKPQRDQILSSAIEEAFRANEEQDRSYGMGEPATTQPHGSKFAMPNPLAGGRSPVNFAASIPKTTSQPSALMPDPLKPLGMQATKPPGIKPPQTPGYNIKSEVQSNANTMHAGNSMMSRENRAAGSPF